MEEKQWFTETKKDLWGRGPWLDEPDKMQWETASGLPGLIVRGALGSLCGYAGVQVPHPYFGIDYHGCPEKCGLPSYADDGEERCSHEAPDAVIEVHGGLTFSGFCQAATLEKWEEWITWALSAKVLEEALQFPMGDAARILKERRDQINSFDAWAAYIDAHAICHHDPGGERVWWLGFDCNHYQDLAPEMRHTMKRIGSSYGSDGVYRDLSYVRSQVESLAAQLKEKSA